MTGISAPVIGLLVGAALLLAVIWPVRVHRAPAVWLWGAAVGLAVVSGWATTAWVARDGFAVVPVMSHSFAAPLGDTLAWTLYASGIPVSFALGSVFGVVLGAAIGSLIKGQFRWEACEDHRELRRQIGGAALMGVGGAVALGCSVGQGLTAMSVLAWGAPITLGAIWAGAWLGLRQLIGGFAAL